LFWPTLSALPSAPDQAQRGQAQQPQAQVSRGRFGAGAAKAGAVEGVVVGGLDEALVALDVDLSAGLAILGPEGAHDRGVVPVAEQVALFRLGHAVDVPVEGHAPDRLVVEIEGLGEDREELVVLGPGLGLADDLDRVDVLGLHDLELEALDREAVGEEFDGRELIAGLG